MINELEQGLPELRAGDHLGMVYRSLEEKISAVSTFVKGGLAKGACCVYVADESTVEEISDSLCASGVNVAESIQRGNLRFLTKWEYRRQPELDIDVMTDVINGLVDQVSATGCAGLWLAVEMTWTLAPEVDQEQLLKWEATLDSILNGMPAVVLCLYNQTKMALVDLNSALRTHPFMMGKGLVCPNPYYDPPELILGSEDGLKQKVDWMLSHIQAFQGQQQAQAEAGKSYQVGGGSGNGSLYERIPDLEKSLSGLQQLLPQDPAQLLIPSLEELKTRLEELHIAHGELLNRNRELEAVSNALAEERQRYQELFELAPDGYLVTDLAGNIREANQMLGSQLGLSSKSLLGKPLVILVAPEDRRDFSFQLQRLGRNQQSSEFETRFKPREGAIFSVRLTVQPVREPQGQITVLHWLVQDITQQRRAAGERAQDQEEIASYQEAFRQLSDGIQDFAIFLLDPSGCVATWNHGAQEIKGYAAAEIIGRHFSCFYPEEDLQRGKPQRLLETAATRGNVEDEGWRVRKDGTRFWASVLITALRAPGGELRGFAKVVRDLTERKQAEEALAFQGEVMRNMADGVVVLRNSDGTMVYTNPRFEEMFGYDQGELIGQHISIVNAHDENSPEEIAREILAVLEREGAWVGEVHNVKKDGTDLWSHVRVSAFNHPEYGDVWVSIQTDITQRKEAEEALRESEARFRSLVESANSAIVTSDEDGRIISWNRGALDIFGYTQEEVLGQPATFLVPERYRRAYQRALIQGVEAGKGNLPGKPVEFQALNKDGSEFPIEVSLFSWSVGSRRFFSAIIQNITGRKQAEKDRFRLRELALEEAERRRLQTLIDTSPVGVMVVDARTQRLVLVNREAQRLRGDSYQPGKLLSECGQDITYRTPDGRGWETADLPLWRALNFGETVRAEEVIMEFPDGHTIPTLVNATPVYSEERRIVSAIAIIQDLTPLQELEKLRNEFLGMVTHELRTPLSTIKGAAATGLRSRAALRPGESQEFFKIIEEQVDHLTDLVNNLLDMTSIEAGVFAVAVEPTDLPSILEEAISDFRRIQSNCLVECQITEDLPQVDADRRRIIQVLTNLLDNAARFSPPGSPIIVEVEHDEGYVTTYVRDSGPGIPEEKLPYLFKKFARIDENSAGNYSGLGLGLAICQGIVEAHGGSIWATNGQEGTGTSIGFTLVEAAEVNTLSPAPFSLEGVSAEGTGAPGERFKILAVDDDQNALRFLRRLLEDAGYLPLLSGDPGEVLEIVEVQRPDLVLLDIMLPQASGLDLMKRIREYSDVPVMFLTARDTRDDMVNALKAGGDDYITKPFSESELLARTEAILRRRAKNGNVGATTPYEFDGLTIDFDQRRVTVAGREVSLSATEYRLICELAEHAGRVMTHDQILQLVWGRDYYGETELVRSMVRRLRNKLGDDAQNPRYIFTVAQVGYRMACP